MPDKKSSTTDDATTEESGGGKKRLIIVAGLCLGLAGAGFVLGGRLSGGGDAEAAAVETTVPEDTEPTIAAIVDLEPVNINLADGHYLRVAIAIGLSEEALHHDEEEGAGGHGAATDETEIPFEKAPASDLLLGTFAGRDMAELSTQAGRESARHDLLEGLENFYGEDIITVYLTEFVMQ